MINESLVYLSYHNIDMSYAFRLANLLLRYYRNVWLDRFEIGPNEDWEGKIRQLRNQATGAIVVVSDDYLRSPYCRAEFDHFKARDIAITAVIPRDFSTELIADFPFDDWIDFRRWFENPDDHSVENLLSRIPESASVLQTGERLDYLRGFIEETELSLAKMPTSWATMRNSDISGNKDIRPRLYQTRFLQGWDFTGLKAGNALPVEDLLQWAEAEPQFIIRGDSGSGKTFFARLLALAQAQAAIHDEGAALPIWLDLAHWDEQHHSLEAFIEAQWSLLSFWQHWLETHRALFVLDNWNVFCADYPALVSSVSNWIDASPKHKFLILSTGQTNAEPSLPVLETKALTTALAQKFASGYLTLEQQNSFRQLLRQKRPLIENSQLDYLSIGLELLANDRSLAFSQWQKNPLPALIAMRSRQLPSAFRGLRTEQVLKFLQALAWSMMLQDNHRFLPRNSASLQGADAGIIDCALELGIVSIEHEKLHFTSEIFQSYLAIENLKKDGMAKYLTSPEFSALGGRRRQKWDSLALLVVDSLTEENRLRAIDRIVDIDPFVANMCLQRHPELYGSYQQRLIAKLVQLCAQNPTAQNAFREAVRNLPKPDITADLLIQQLGHYDNPKQLWLWHEIRALPLELPIDFIETVAEIDRNSPASEIDQLAGYPLSLSVAYLLKLSQDQDLRLRRNAIWILGELKYLPTALPLLNCLEEDWHDDDRGEIVLALMKYAYSDILTRVLHWSQDNPQHRSVVIEALAEQKRLVSSQLLALADAGRLTLNPEFYEIVVNTAESDIALGLARVAAQQVDLPDMIQMALLGKKNSNELQHLLAGAIKHLPNREGFQQLLSAIERVLEDPPEPTIIAGSNLEALVYGEPLFDKSSVAAAPTSALPVELLEQLHHSDWQQRHRALNRLIDYPTAAILPLLLEATNDDDKSLRLAAYEMLCQFEGEPAAQKAVIAALSDPDQEIVAAIIDLLKTATAVDYEALIDLLDSDNARTVAAAISILGDAQYQPATAELRQLLDDGRRASDDDISLSRHARAALDAIANAEPRLEESISASDAESSRDTEQSRDAFSDEEKITRTLEVLRDDDWGRTQKAAKFLRKFAKYLRGRDNLRIMRLLCSSLSDDNWSVRWAVAEALAMLRNREAIPYLSEGLNDPSWIVQVAVVRSLVELGAVDSVDRMMPLLQSSQKAVREATVEALGELQYEGAIPMLSETLKRDPDGFVRLAALKAICQIKPTDVRSQLEYALSDGYLHLRWYAMKQLAPDMDETDLPLLQQLLHDDAKPSWEEESLRDLAIQALRRIDSDACRALLLAAEKQNAL